MTDDEETELARRLVASEWWDWREGMAQTYTPSGARSGLPDLRDPATAGCLLVMLLQHARDRGGEVEVTGYLPSWEVMVLDGEFNDVVSGVPIVEAYGKSPHLGVAVALALVELAGAWLVERQ